MSDWVTKCSANDPGQIIVSISIEVDKPELFTSPPTVDASGTLKHDIPTTAADGTVRNVFIWSDTTLATLLVKNIAVTASAGHFKLPDTAAVVGTARPAMLVAFGADANAVANGGACWATGILE